MLALPMQLSPYQALFRLHLLKFSRILLAGVQQLLQLVKGSTSISLPVRYQPETDTPANGKKHVRLTFDRRVPPLRIGVR